MTWTDAVVALLLLVGIVGIVVPILPGTILIGSTLLVWAVLTGGAAWWWFAAIVVVLLVGTVVQYAVPGKRLKAAGIPTRTLLVGGVLGVVGFFVVPVVGLVIGFVLGVYLAETSRVGREEAWPSTVHALKAVGLSMAIEATAAVVASSIWLVAAFRL
ncbi:uncharacterized protein YqgC (DUF456 family) [Nocardioides zeae]|uniref:Uncharacterized protein YqgC (DUF456 family) n=1 Tax=Nocardioides zeae TaxID=1457234 RepID=A0ACC6IMK9_9ACTN|nr:DUF456 domain-containing protein [Nocardioides zeae]MDR6175956.1 uncharacterized protein YqgC (DUF456 family) [Nocardioides zeae]MDR6211747.1 uncharacterized protein YqgC (DUF456 family) [Nocardioides zeae]